MEKLANSARRLPSIKRVNLSTDSFLTTPQSPMRLFSNSQESDYSDDLSKKIRNNWHSVKRFSRQINDATHHYGLNFKARLKDMDENCRVVYRCEMHKVKRRVNSVSIKKTKIKEATITEQKILEGPLNWFKEEAMRLFISIEKQKSYKQFFKDKLKAIASDLECLNQELETLTIEEAKLKADNVNTNGTQEHITYKEINTMPKICQRLRYMLNVHIEAPRIRKEITTRYKAQERRNSSIIKKLKWKHKLSLIMNTSSNKLNMGDTNFLFDAFIYSIEKVKPLVLARVAIRAGQKMLPLVGGRSSGQIYLSDFNAAEKSKVFATFIGLPSVCSKITALLTNETAKDNSKAVSLSKGSLLGESTDHSSFGRIHKREEAIEYTDRKSQFI